MSTHKLSKIAPLLTNEDTGEVYLRLPEPHSNIIITPARQDEVEITALVTALNDHRVISWLEIPFYPYEVKHARDWLATSYEATHDLLEELNRSSEYARGCPVYMLREVVDDGHDMFIGCVRFWTWGFYDIMDSELQARLVKENEARKPGHPEKEWSCGDYLIPSHHRRGIMTAAIRTLIDQWLKPRMGVRRISVIPHQGNHGSVRVFEKNGFALRETLENWRTLPASRGGKKVGIHVLEWKS